MSDLASTLSTLRRPRLLVRAARFGAAFGARRPALGALYRRAPDRLLDEELALNTARISGDAGYSPTRHVEVLSALLAASGPERV